MVFSLFNLGMILLLQSGHAQRHTIDIPPPFNASLAVYQDFQSFSIEFSFFPDYAGNQSNPNTFSKNLLENFKNVTGVYPKIRVGGTSQDHADYFPEQEEAVKLIFEHPTDDQPIQINYGPAYFESYHTLGNVKFFHGLNLNQNHSIQQLTEAATVSCTNIGSHLELYELGNEWNFAHQNYRPGNYSMDDYVHEWNYKSAAVVAAVQKACPGKFPGFMAPSFVLLDFITSNGWTADGLYQLGYDRNNLTKILSFHNYMGVNSPPNPPVDLDLQRTLMNHTSIVENLAPQIQRAQNLAYLGLPFTLGETNSIANQGITGETSVFGDALWLVDFSLWAAANNIRRLHFHQGLDYRYDSWQPILSKGQAPTTRPPYYGQIMVASVLGKTQDTRIVNIPLSGDTEATYGIYNGNKVSKVVALNLRERNATSKENRPSQQFKFHVPGQHRANIERLTAPGSDSATGVTFGGISYDYARNNGLPVIVDGRKETLDVEDEVLSVDVPDSSAVLISFV